MSIKTEFIKYDDVVINVSDISYICESKIDNPSYVPPIPHKGIKEQNAPPYFSKTLVALKSGSNITIEIPYKDFMTKFILNVGVIDFK